MSDVDARQRSFQLDSRGCFTKQWLMAILVVFAAFQIPTLAMGVKQFATETSAWTVVGGTPMNESLAGSSGDQVVLMVEQGTSVCRPVCRVIVYSICRMLGVEGQDCEYIAETICELVCTLIGD